MRLELQALYLSLLCIITLTCFASTKDTNNPKKPFYLKLDAGISIPSSKLNEGEYDKKKPSNTGFYGIGIGYIINDKFRTDVSLSHRVNYAFNQNKTEDTIIETMSQNFSNVSLMTNLYYMIYKKSNFSPYFNIGLGVGHNYSSKYTEENINSADSSLYMIKTASPAGKFNVVYNVGAGINWILKKIITVDLNYKYINLGKLASANYLNRKIITNAPPVQLKKSPGKLTMHEISIGIIYKF